ncbi:uncharacterized protein N7511_001454 [Penicillium nucicola]|uniref:uncharacterized protein n=1 Tax=Penicillium nucicola TaxID=1850975 RepID=UPI0025453EBF|nr:uncharacterized protein N7511_001454 [Penicillium nucicola]KAJ5776443.1 hypothetical protein N7511_001454 [Penicillium nucicola]
MSIRRPSSAPLQTVMAFYQTTLYSASQRRFGTSDTTHCPSNRTLGDSVDSLTKKLQAALENRHQKGRLIEPLDPQRTARMVDFGSNDTLSLSSSEALRQAFLDELAKRPDFEIGSRSTRIFEGTTSYLLELEKHMAQFHGAESALFFQSGYEANVAIWSTIPQPGDIILHDEYIHASIHDGMRQGRAMTRMFTHNSCESLRECLLDICQTNTAVANGEQTVFIALESIYSMDGDMAPVHEMLKLTKEIMPFGNVIFSIDEAHSNGLIGENGSGYICHYGLEKEFPIRLHTCGKGLGSTGAAVLANSAIRSYLINYARGLIFSTAPAFPSLAAVKGGYRVLASKEGEERRIRLQNNTRRFYEKLTCHSEWAKCVFSGILSLPAEKTCNTGPYLAPIIPLITESGQAASLAQKLQDAGYQVNAVFFPIVPREKERVRVVMHADNTATQIDEVVDLIMGWSMTCLAGQLGKPAGRMSSPEIYQNAPFSD